MLRDYEIRTALKMHLAEMHSGEPDTLIVDELGLCQGLTRADVAVVNGQLSAFEIKSDADTLVRLTTQIDQYSRVCDRVTIVLGPKHVAAAKAIVPDWWGIWTVSEVRDRITIKKLRKGRINRSVDAASLVQFLWKEEAFGLLEKYQRSQGLKSKPKKALWDRLVDTLPIDTLRDEVRVTLKTRTGWRITAD
ncbi:MAG: sce7726 family protein [Pseudogulbenkiania sp.]|nr:sce7726 family protein [Pseudogulbenkiania sp.]